MPSKFLFTPPQGRHTRILLTPGMKFRTTMCRSIAEGVACRFNVRCKFAHNQDELRVRKVNPRFKSQPCREYNFLDTENFICYHGDICSFQHYEEDVDTVIPKLIDNYWILSQMTYWDFSDKTYSSMGRPSSYYQSLDSGCPLVCDNGTPMTSTPNRKAPPFDPSFDGLD